MPGKQDGPSRIIYGPPRPPPPNSPKCAFFHIGAHIWKTGDYFFPLLCICLLCYEVLLPWNFRSPGFDVRPPQDPPKYEKNVLFYHILGLNLKMSYQIASLFHMYIDMGERIAGKQDRFSLIIEDPLRAPKIPPKYTKWFSNCFPLLYICLHCDEVCVCWHFGAPDTPGFYVRAQPDPEKKLIKLF